MTRCFMSTLVISDDKAKEIILDTLKELKEKELKKSEPTGSA